ncbi:hypothetical protein IQ07DRAFT_642388 [Pyrenochaeta sp. DS3sAY3a]|nr:hypothetical protein IQ07DRAFT_642388 [Pyrenochaeta sp. DS3sAY3a]
MATEIPAPNVVKVNGVWQIEGKPREEITIAGRFNPPSLPGKTIIVLSVLLPPSAATPPHKHNGATALAFPVTGRSTNAMNSDAAQTYGPGDFWYEGPGCHHRLSENASQSEEARFWAVLIVDDEVIGGRGGEEYGELVVLDKEVEVGERGASR